MAVIPMYYVVLELFSMLLALEPQSCATFCFLVIHITSYLDYYTTTSCVSMLLPFAFVLPSMTRFN